MHDLIIEPGETERTYWRDLWRYRELLWFLAWRDIRVRYTQTVLGIGWALVRPFLVVVVFTMIFNRIAHLPAPGGVPYIILVTAGLLPWQFVSSCLAECSNSVVGNASLVSKVYFPRLIIPAGSIMTSFVDFALTLAMLALLLIGYHVAPGWRLVLLPCVIVVATANAFGAGLWLCALTAQYRDFRHIVPFLLQFGLYVSPVGFSTTAVPDKFRGLYSLNPMVGVIDGFRSCLLPGPISVTWPSVLSSLSLGVILCASGLWYFRRMERHFADVI